MSAYHKDIYGYYKILGIVYPSSHDEIKRNYRKQVKKFHPDVNHSHNANEFFQKIQEAYSVLINDLKKEHYDSICMAYERPNFNDRENNSKEEKKESPENKGKTSSKSYDDPIDKYIKKEMMKSNILFIVVICGMFGFVFLMIIVFQQINKSMGI